MKNILSFFLIVFSFCFHADVTAQVKHTKAKTTKAPIKSHDMLSLLQGKWASLDDKKSFLLIKGDKQISIYGKDALDTSTINFYETYPDNIKEDDAVLTSGKYLVTRLKKDDYYIYSVEGLSSQNLSLMYLPRGNILRYRKVK